MIIIQFLFSILLAYGAGVLVQKLSLPSILGWLLAGIIIGPNVLGLLSDDVMDAGFYFHISNLAQMLVGIMLGSNLVWEKLKKAGKDILQMTLAEMSGVFFLMFILFGILFYIADYPILLAFIFASIAIATAPAPPLSIISEYKTEGPLTRMMVPLTVTNSVFTNLFFFIVISIIRSFVSAAEVSIPVILSLMLAVPILLGFFLGWLTTKFSKDGTKPIRNTVLFLVIMVAVLLSAYLMDTYLYPFSLMNYILLGIGFGAGYVNFLSEETADAVGDHLGSFETLGLMIVILNLSAPIDPSLLLEAGILSVVYLVVRSLGLFIGTKLGGRLIDAHENVRNIYGLHFFPTRAFLSS